ncbi:hypothetical protein [Thermococcus sp. 2319x1]|uniref:hypothetical protein n=1 Tax=Thermococcus sp. 2319x1 TaxID=1674923 RepID=UPI0015815D23|nr:hypothetical protein [Thermococcus sp. 2319x1]
MINGGSLKALKGRALIYSIFSLILLLFAVFGTIRTINSGEIIRLHLLYGFLMLLAAYLRKYTVLDISSEKMMALGLMIVATSVLWTYLITDRWVLSVFLGIVWGSAIAILSYAIILYNKSKYLQNSKWAGRK